jgi:hypothetical protein
MSYQREAPQGRLNSFDRKSSEMVQTNKVKIDSHVLEEGSGSRKWVSAFCEEYHRSIKYSISGGSIHSESDLTRVIDKNDDC